MPKLTHSVVAALLLLGTTLAVQAAPTIPSPTSLLTEEDLSRFEDFKRDHNKTYLDAHDEAFRAGVFARNLRKIERHNREADQGKHGYRMGMNAFGDLTAEEFHASLRVGALFAERNQYIRSVNTKDLSARVPEVDSIDWTKRGAVTPVATQGQCGSCWAFTAIGAMEGAWEIHSGNLIPLSVQQMMDCSKDEGTAGCQGGMMDDGFEWAIKNGACSAADYPYVGEDETCKKGCTPVATFSSYHDVSKTESALQAAVTMQPVSVGIQALNWQFYTSGVFTDDCPSQPDHSALVVGFGTDDGTKYWKLKNSWGAAWGMEGYILIEKGKDQEGGQCGVLTYASYPTV